MENFQIGYIDAGEDSLIQENDATLLFHGSNFDLSFTSCCMTLTGLPIPINIIISYNFILVFLIYSWKRSKPIGVIQCLGELKAIKFDLRKGRTSLKMKRSSPPSRNLPQGEVLSTHQLSTILVSLTLKF